MEERHKQTMFEILFDNGYEIVAKSKNPDVPIPCEYVIKARKPINVNDKKVTGGDLMVFFIKGDKLHVKRVREMIEYQEKNKIPIIIGVGAILTPNTKRAARAVVDPYRLILFKLNRLNFNWSKNKRVFGKPVTVYQNREEQDALLAKMEIDRTSLSHLFNTDAVCEYYLAVPGDIIVYYPGDEKHVKLVVPKEL